MKTVLKRTAATAAVLALCALIGLTLGCPIKAVTGFPCPGCGVTRACLALMRLDFAAAFRWHPLCLLAPLAAAVYIFRDACPPLRLFTKTPALISAAVLTLAVYIWRMAAMFPVEPPMNFRENSLFGEFVLNLLLH